MLKRLVIVATVYMVWQERNRRTFHDHHKSIDDICNMIIDNVRFMIMGLRINESVQVFEAARIWKYHVKKVTGKSKVIIHNDRS